MDSRFRRVERGDAIYDNKINARSSVRGVATHLPEASPALGRARGRDRRDRRGVRHPAGAWRSVRRGLARPNRRTTNSVTNSVAPAARGDRTGRGRRRRADVPRHVTSSLASLRYGIYEHDARGASLLFSPRAAARGVTPRTTSPSPGRPSTSAPRPRSNTSPRSSPSPRGRRTPPR